jgi:hypothetical protein
MNSSYVLPCACRLSLLPAVLLLCGFLLLAAGLPDESRASLPLLVTGYVLLFNRGRFGAMQGVCRKSCTCTHLLVLIRVPHLSWFQLVAMTPPLPPACRRRSKS